MTEASCCIQKCNRNCELSFYIMVCSEYWVDYYMLIHTYCNGHWWMSYMLLLKVLKHMYGWCCCSNCSLILFLWSAFLSSLGWGFLVFMFAVRFWFLGQIWNTQFHCRLQFLFRLRQNCNSWEILHIYKDIIIYTHCQELTACIVVLHSNSLFLFNLIEMASWPSFANGFNNAWIQQT